MKDLGTMLDPCGSWGDDGLPFGGFGEASAAQFNILPFVCGIVVSYFFNGVLGCGRGSSRDQNVFCKGPEI